MPGSLPSGVLPVLATPFDEGDHIDLAAVADEVDWLIGQGADGITVAMVSEIRRLSDDERLRLTDAVCRAAADRVPVIASVGAESTACACALARGARDAGASAVMATPPLLLAVPTVALRRYVAGIVEAAEVPVVFQDASAYVGSAVTADLQAALVREHGADRFGLKPEASPVGPLLETIHDLTGGAARIYDGGGGADLADTYRIGVVGTMPGPDLVWAVRRVWDLLGLGLLAPAMRLTSYIAAIGVLAPGLDGYVAVEKHLLHRQGVLPRRRVRGPEAFVLSPGCAELVNELADQLAEAVRSTDPLVANGPTPGNTEVIPQ